MTFSYFVCRLAVVFLRKSRNRVKQAILNVLGILLSMWGNFTIENGKEFRS